jgi:DNA mismatch repair ATPase MutS
MREMRVRLDAAGKLKHPRQKQRWFLDAVVLYCDAVAALAERLDALDLTSRGLRAFRDYVSRYVSSESFVALHAESRRVRDGLAGVRYAVHVKGTRVRVSRFAGEQDYSAAIEDTFARFRQGAAKDHRATFHDLAQMSHVEARILDFVAQLFPDEFGALDAFCTCHAEYLDGTISAFDREVQFYLAYLEYIQPFRSAGLPFCYPAVSKEEDVRDAFDIALAGALLDRGSRVVCNDFTLHDPERILVVTGPNGGGKSSFARMFGQIHHLARLGLPVPGTEATLHLPDRIFTHFEKEEDPATLRGKLEDELTRIHDILDAATGNSVIVMNESFASTTLNDALAVGRAVLERITTLGALCVYVTFVDELASLNDSTVSMVSGVEQDNPAVRTYRIERRPADGLAYAAAIAQKYGLTYETLRTRVRR